MFQTPGVLINAGLHSLHSVQNLIFFRIAWHFDLEWLGRINGGGGVGWVKVVVADSGF